MLPPQPQPPSLAEPPPFQEAPRCDVCKCSFNAFRRRHHCRCCGRTLCHEHSSNQMALPQFGIYSSVRACSECFNKFSRLGKNEPPNYVDAFDATPDTIARLKMDLDVGAKVVSNARNAASEDVPECKCGMPLCICEAPKPDPAPLQMQKSTTSTVQSNPRPKKAMSTQETAESISKNVASSSNNNKTSLFFNLGQANNGSLDKANTDYEVNGEGVREAIKNNDATAVKRLLSEGVDPNYCDKQGLTLLHLAAVFNQTEIAFILMDHGASLECKNAQGETPLDCAPTMLQYKMSKRMEGGA